MSLWLMPTGELVYKKARVRKKKGPQPLLIHVFNEPDRGRIALISRVITWVADGNCSALPELLSENDLADAYSRGFFHAIQDGPSNEKGRLAVANITRRKLIENQIAAQQNRKGKGDKS